MENAINKRTDIKKFYLYRIINLCSKNNLSISNKSFEVLKKASREELKDYIKQLENLKEKSVSSVRPYNKKHLCLK